MPRPDYRSLRRALIRSGIAPGHVHRTLTELDDHFDDLVEAALAEGCSRHEAEGRARRKLGKFDDIVVAMNEHPELKSWAWRFPRLALLVYPLACVAALPAVPVIAGVQHAPVLARWAACLLLSGLVTASMFLILVLSITLG